MGKLYNFSDQNTLLQYFSATFDETLCILYVYNSINFIEIDLNNMHIKQHKPHSECDGDFSLTTVINSEFHIIGGFEHDQHLIWYRNTRQFVEKPIATIQDEYNPFASYTLIHIPSKHLLLRMCDDGEHNYCDYSSKDYKWILKEECEDNFCSNAWGYSYINHTNYIMRLDSDGKICIIDVVTRKIHKCMISVPLDYDEWSKYGTNCNILGMDDEKEKREEIVQGYIRMNHIEFPADLIGLLSLYYSDVNVHLLANKGNLHFKISLHVLIKDMECLGAFWQD